MEWVETTGKTIEEAKRAALDELGVDESDADFEIVAEPKIGLFGRIKEEARVRARVQPRYPRSKGDRRDRRRTRAANDSAPTGAGPSPEPTKARPESASRPTNRPSSSAEPDDESQAPQAAAPRRRRSGSSRSNQGGTTGSGESGSVDAVTTTAPTEEQRQAAEQFVRGLLQEMGLGAEVSSTATDASIDVDVNGEDLGVLIGPKGATLAALQELTRTVLQRQGAQFDARVTVDVNGYRRRRTEALARFARQQAAEVAASGIKRALEPMSAADRKVVHDAVTGMDGVVTASEGEEPARRVVILPSAPQPANAAAAASEE
ncbi:MAG TPA: RNA-binding cell elongation regulator Jag/EloR [Acidimicrobiales bacterium]|nr:RNA-binding cell elongation regulator Jag/EloR [Acidimicrobiales bacterium]